MSYFDHVRCPSCKATMNPEQVQSGSGRARCPHCSEEIGLVDFFGVSAAFSEEEQADVTLDDLVPNFDPNAVKKKKPAPRAKQGGQAAGEPARKFDDPLDVLDALKAMKKKRR